MAINQLVIDLSVRKKLSSAFGIVLLITFFISIISYYALDTLLTRITQVNKVSEITVIVEEAGQDQKDFLLTYSPHYIKSAQDKTKQILGSIPELRDSLTSQASRNLLQQVENEANSYLTQLHSVESYIADSLTVRKNLEDSASYAINVFISLSETFASRLSGQIEQRDLQGIAHTAELYNLTANATKALQGANLDAKDFVTYRRQSDIDGVTAKTAEVDRYISGLNNLIVVAEHRNELNYAVEQLTLYRNNFQQYVSLHKQTTEARELMTQHADAVTYYAKQSADYQFEALQKDTVKLEFIIITAAIIAILIGLFAAITITKMIVTPLQRVVAVVQRIADGDLTQNLEVNRKDELGQLMSSTQQMTENLRNLIQRLSLGISQIATATEEMSAITEQNNVGINQQRSETEQVATAMNEMTSTVQEVARSAEDASTAATESTHQAHIGEEIVQKTMQQIRLLADEVTTSATAITELKNQTNNIGAVLDVIKSVADQTNLLALNAAIEAARAGESGRGFAVVAEEVRALALRTQESTVQIEDLINTLQQKAENAVSSMGKSSVLAASTLENADNVNTAINTITHAVSNIQLMNQQIAAAALEQSTVAESINLSITSIKDIAEQSAMSSEETAAASADLSRLGVELQTQAMKFKA